jgi:hypothetical protein
MSRAKVFITILTVLILITLSGASVWAAPGGQEEEPTIISIVDKIEIDEETEPPTVLVTLVFVDETTNEPTGETQTVRVSLETAIRLGLVVEGVDEQGNPTFEVNQEMIDNGEPVEIPPDEVIEVIEEDEEEEGEEAQHPVASALFDVFGSALGLDYDTIMSRHEEGFGFGVIAQACWMSYALEGNVDLWGDILDAKKSGDFSPIPLSEDGETPRNWGLFKKAVLKSDNEKVKKNLANLGAIMSGRVGPLDGTDSGGEDENENELGATSTQGKVKGQKDKAGGKPDIPPGQVKNKDKGKGGGKKN